MNYKVFITTSGIGSRLGELTKDTNKSLVEVGGKAVIEHIVDLYPRDVEIVVALGYFGDKVKKFLRKKFPNRKFTFVQVDKFQGEGSSLGYSMLKAKDFLQCPFIFHCNDTIVKGKIPSPTKYNWNAGSKGLDTEIYNTAHLSSFTVKDKYMDVMNRKGAEKWNLFHIGLVGLKDFKDFWDGLESRYNEKPNDSTLNDCAAIQVMINKGLKFRVVEFTKWYDTGNLNSLAHTRQNLA